MGAFPHALQSSLLYFLLILKSSRIAVGVVAVGEPVAHRLFISPARQNSHRYSATPGRESQRKWLASDLAAKPSRSQDRSLQYVLDITAVQIFVVEFLRKLIRGMLELSHQIINAVFAVSGV